MASQDVVLTRALDVVSAIADELAPFTDSGMTAAEVAVLIRHIRSGVAIIESLRLAAKSLVPA